jgi:Activator of Hsp90 ATPase homolog 1-like protein
MPVAPDAILQDQEGRSVLRFERILRYPPERVWRALTDPTEQRSWHPTPFELEPVVGGQVTYLPGGDVPEMASGEVTGSTTRYTCSRTPGATICCVGSCGPTTRVGCSCSRTPSTTTSRPRATQPAGTSALTRSRQPSTARSRLMARTASSCQVAGGS